MTRGNATRGARKLAGPVGTAAVLLVLGATPLDACPVCFGQSDSPLASATNWGIAVLLLVTGGVLSAFVGFFFYLLKRSRTALEEMGAAPSGPRGGR